MLDLNQTPDAGQGPEQKDPAPQDGGRNYEAEIEKLRKEAAKWRVQAQETKSKLSELEPAVNRLQELENAQKTEAEKLTDRLAKMEAELTSARAQAETAEKQRRLMALAAKASVPAELLTYLDASKFDLDDEKTTLEVLGQLARPKANAGNPSNPARGNLTDADRKALLYGADNRNLIFGG
jgi:chromosome segregation ATPase